MSNQEIGRINNESTRTDRQTGALVYEVPEIGRIYNETDKHTATNSAPEVGRVNNQLQDRKGKPEEKPEIGLIHNELENKK